MAASFPDTLRIERDIPYLKRGPDWLALDLYTPSDAPRGIVLFAHGGGFHKGDRREGRVFDIATRLAAEGYATVSASYRLATPLDAFAPEERARIRTHQRRTSRAGVTLAKRLTGAAFEAARRDLGAAVGFLREAGPAFGLQSDKVLMIGVSAGAIAGLSLAFPPRDMPPAPAPDALLALSGAMVQPWRLTRDAPPCLMLNSHADKIISPRNVAVTRKRVLTTEAPVSFLTCARRGHNAPVRALLEDADEAGTPYWTHMMELFSPSHAVA